MEVFNLSVWGIVFFIVIVGFFRAIRLVPTKRAFIVERLGKIYAAHVAEIKKNRRPTASLVRPNKAASSKRP